MFLEVNDGVWIRMKDIKMMVRMLDSVKVITYSNEAFFLEIQDEIEGLEQTTKNTVLTGIICFINYRLEEYEYTRSLQLESIKHECSNLIEELEDDE